MLTVDGTALVQLVNFAIFFAILNVVFLRPVGRAIRKRREYIDGVHGDYERYQRDARTLRAEADAKRVAARNEAQGSVATARTKAEAEAAAIAAGFAGKAEAIADEARATVEGELTKARARENELAGALAATLVERAVGNNR